MSIVMPRAYDAMSASRWDDSHGTWANRRAWAASRSARNIRTSEMGVSRPSANASMLVGSRTVSWSWDSGTPTSVRPKTSLDRVPAAVPICIPNTAAPIWFMIREGSKSAPPEKIPSSADGIPGKPEISNPMCSSLEVPKPSGRFFLRISPSAADTDFATGSTSFSHAGRVASTHWARLIARDFAPDGGNSVAASSQSSATESACTTSRSWLAMMVGSPPETET